MKQNLAAARRFIQTINPTGKAVYIAALWPKELGARPPGGNFQRTTTLGDRDAEYLCRMNDQGFGIYVAPNGIKRGMRHGGHGENVTELRSLWADFDDPEHPPPPLDRKADIVVESSAGRYQLHWVVEGPPATAQHQQEHEKQLKQLAAGLGGDPRPTQPGALMRMPGFINTKADREGFVSKLLRCKRPPQATAPGAIVRALGVYDIHIDSEEREPLRRTVALDDISQDKAESNARAELDAQTYPNKERNCEVHRLAKKHLWDNGVAPERAEQIMLEWSSRFTGTLDDDETITAVRNAYKYARNEFACRYREPKKFERIFHMGKSKPCPNELAGLYIQELEKTGPVVTAQGTLYAYSGRCFEAVDEETARTFLCRERLAQSHDHAKTIYKSAMDLTRDRSFFENPPVGCAFANCFVRIDDQGKIITEPHSPEHRVVGCMNYNYDPTGDVEAWDGYMEDLLGDLESGGGPEAQTIAEYLGACLMGQGAKLQRALFIVGGAGTGKSTFNNIIEDMFRPDDLSAVKPAMWSGKGSNFMLVALKDKLLNLVGELPVDRLNITDEFKKIVGGSDTIFADIKNRDPVTFKSTAGHIFVGNAMPKLSDFSDAVMERWVPIPFDRKIGRGLMRQGESIRRKVYEQRPAIAARFVRAYRDMLFSESGALTVPQSSRDKIREWRAMYPQEGGHGVPPHMSERPPEYVLQPDLF